MGKKILTMLLVMAMVVSLLAGCGVPTTSTDDKEKKESDSTAQKEDSTSDKDDSSKGDSSESASSDEPITLKVVDWSDSTAEVRRAFDKVYMEEHPNITIEYTTMTIDAFKSSVVTSIKSGEAPDLFPIPVGITLPTAIAENWFVPLNDYLPDEFWDTIIDPAKAEGVAMLNGNYYTIPEVATQTNQLIFYNKDVFEKAGVTEVPTTYSEFIDVCDQITEAGNGDYYAFIEGGKQVNRVYALLQAFANVGGAKLPDFSKALVDGGRINYDSQAVLEATKLFKTLYDHGDIHPDSINISAPEAREYFAQGQAAFIDQGVWCIGVWESTHPDMNFGTMAVPVPDSGQKGKISTPEYGAWMGVYANSEHPKEAAEYLAAMYNYGSDKYTYQDDLVSKGGRVSIVKGVTEANMTNERVIEYFNIANETAATYPIATVRDPKIYDFYNKVVDVQPSIGNLFQGVLSGGLDDYESSYTSLSDDLTAEWTRACEAVGTTIDSLDFPNWDPMKDYGAEQYKELN